LHAAFTHPNGGEADAVIRAESGASGDAAAGYGDIADEMASGLHGCLLF
jgi:hypothetical protein